MAGLGVVAAAVIAGIAVRVPDASAHGVQPVGTIGQDGWVNGPGYEVRIFPNWYDNSPASSQGNILVLYDGRYTGVFADLTLVTVHVQRGATIHGKGGHAFRLQGAPGLTFVYPNVRGNYEQQWLVIRGSLGYILTFRTIAPAQAFLEHNVSTMISSWRWNATLFHSS